MNYIRHLAGFFDRVSKDDRLGPLHISMYVSLFQFWNASRFRNPISISRSELMRVSKISAKATYHKCIKELNNYGYLKYEPSFNPIRGSLVYLFNFETGDELLEESSHTKIETASRQLNEPYINSLNIINNKTVYEYTDEDTSSNFDKVEAKREKDLSMEKKSRLGAARPHVPSSVIDVKKFFEEKRSSTIEAEKFFNHYQSNGWKVGGRAPMKDWRASALNWILNTQKFEVKNRALLHTQTNKDYGEPL